MGDRVLLPKVVVGDFIVFKDVGAYTTSMWSRYNSRQLPAILGYTLEDLTFLN